MNCVNMDEYFSDLLKDTENKRGVELSEESYKQIKTALEIKALPINGIKISLYLRYFDNPQEYKELCDLLGRLTKDYEDVVEEYEKQMR